MIEREDMVGQRFELWGRQRDIVLFIKRSVDITDECPRRKEGNRKVRLDFTTVDDKHTLVKVADCASGKDVGIEIVVFADELLDLDTDVTAYFCSFAIDFGLKPVELRDIVLELVTDPVST